MSVFDVLNKLKWTGKLKDAEIIILHRGVKGNRKNISGNLVTEVKKSYFMCKPRSQLEGEKKVCLAEAKPRSQLEGETLIPLHRVLEIKLKGKILFKRASSR